MQISEWFAWSALTKEDERHRDLDLHLINAYIECMKRMQYTIRNIDEKLNSIAREQAQTYGKSLNAVLLDALSRGLGVENEKIRFHDMDDLAGQWIEDPEFDAAIKAFDAVDENLWK